MRTTALTALFGLLIVAACAVGAKGEKNEKEPPGVAPAAPATPPKVAEVPTDPVIKQLLEDLASEDWRTRERAGKELAAKGEKALPAMKRAMLATDNPEVQRRLSVLVRKMDRDRLIEPKRITYSAKDKTAKHFFDEIAKQSGYKMEFGGGGAEGKYSFEFNNTPFWQAMDMVANAAGYNVQTDYDDDTVRVYNQNASNPYVAYSGPFRFLATNIQSSRNVQLSGIGRGGNPPINEYINLSFQIQSEPKNPMLGIMQPELTEAKDDLGGSLLPPKERNGYRNSNYYNNGYRGHSMYTSVNLQRADRAATTIKSLKGHVSVVLLAGTVAEVVVADPLKVKKQSFAGRTTELSVESVDEDANQKGTYLVSFTAKKLTPSDPNRNDDYMWGQNMQQRIELSDEKGNKYYSYGANTHENNGNGTVRLVLVFGPDDRRTGRPGPAKLGPPKRLVLNEWVTLTHEVNFEFKDVPLP